MDWFLYDRDLRHERVNVTESCFPTEVQVTNQSNAFDRSGRSATNTSAN